MKQVANSLPFAPKILVLVASCVCALVVAGIVCGLLLWPDAVSSADSVGAASSTGAVSSVGAASNSAQTTATFITEPSTSGSDATIGFMIVAEAALTLWGASMYVRCSDAVVRRYLVAIVALFVFWLLAVVVKYASSNNTVGQACWYLYYVALIFAPALCFFAGLRSAGLGRGKRGRICHAVIMSISALLVLLVLTNNAHMLVFVFDPGSSTWDSDYSYALGYWLITCWEYILLAAFFALLFRSARLKKRTALLPIGFICLLAIMYGILYIFRLDVVFRGNFSLTYIICFTLALELCLDLGLLPSFLRYAQSFSELPFDAKILSFDGTQVYATTCANALQPAEKEALLRTQVPPSVKTSFKVSEYPNKAYKLYAVHGGLVLLTEDRAAINKDIEILRERQGMLLHRNEVLAQDIALKKRLYQQKRERALAEDVRASLSSATSTISNILDELPSAEHEENADERRHSLMLVKLLVAYCKRKGAFVLSEHDDADFNRERLQLAVSETVADVRSAGIDCGALVEINTPLPAASLSTLYDCFYDMLAMAFECFNPTLMIFITEVDNKRVELRVVLECADNINFATSEAAAGLRSALENRDVAYRLIGDEGELHLTAVVLKEQETSEAGGAQEADEAGGAQETSESGDPQETSKSKELGGAQETSKADESDAPQKTSKPNKAGELQ